MLNIYSYTDSRVIKMEEVKEGQQLRVEGRTQDVEEMLEGLNYKVLTDGHEEDGQTRVYIEVLATEIIVDESLSNKDFKAMMNKIVRRGEIDEVEASFTVWHNECNHVYGLIEFRYEGDNITIAYIDNENSAILDTDEHTKKVMKVMKKARIKYGKWFDNYGITVPSIQELTV